MKQSNAVTVVLIGILALGAALTLWVFSSSGVIPSTSGISGTGQDPGPVIPEVTLATLDGKPVNLLRDRGDVTVLFAMSYWCVTCVPEARALARLYEEYVDKGLRVIVIDLDPDASMERLQTFIDEVGENRLTWAFDTTGEFMRRYHVQALDTTIIVDSEGREVYRDIQSTSYDKLRRELQKVIPS